MHRFAAALLALSVTQQPPATAAPAPPPETAAAEPPGKTATPTPPVLQAEPQPPAEPRPAPPPAAVPAPPPPARPRPAPPAAAPPPSPAVRTPIPPAARTEARPPAPPPPVAAPEPPRGDRERVIRAALAFLDALLAGDGAALAAASSPRFSFDGDVVEGREAQARRWREILSGRAPGGALLRDLVPMTAAEAVEQLGPPPARLAGLLRPGVWVVVADVSTRPVLLLLVADGGRFAVAAMHD